MPFWCVCLLYQQGTPTKGKTMNPMALEITEGFYLNNLGAFKVQQSLKSENLYAKKFNPETKKWEYFPGAVNKLRPETKMTKEQAAQFGHLYGQCIVCMRRLTDEKSIAKGIGPVCESKF